MSKKYKTAIFILSKDTVYYSPTRGRGRTSRDREAVLCTQLSNTSCLLTQVHKAFGTRLTKEGFSPHKFNFVPVCTLSLHVCLSVRWDSFNLGFKFSFGSLNKVFQVNSCQRINRKEGETSVNLFCRRNAGRLSFFIPHPWNWQFAEKNVFLGTPDLTVYYDTTISWCLDRLQDTIFSYLDEEHPSVLKMPACKHHRAWKRPSSDRPWIRLSG